MGAGMGRRRRNPPDRTAVVILTVILLLFGLPMSVMLTSRAIGGGLRTGDAEVFVVSLLALGGGVLGLVYLRWPDGVRRVVKPVSDMMRAVEMVYVFWFCIVAVIAGLLWLVSR